MTGTRRIFTILVSAALTVALTTTALATDVEPAAKKKVTCDGKVATRVGTKGNDVIRGTAKRDIIAGLGGNDIIIGLGGGDTICGGAGNDKLVGNAGNDKLIGQAGRDRLFGGSGIDRLFGGPQNDFLAGQAGPDILGGGGGSDRIDGGIGVDLCAQGTGHGPMVRCELPRAVFAPPAPPAPPAPAPTPEPKTLVIAYSDLDESHTFNAGDVMIAKIIDSDGDTMPSKGDTIVMGRYPIAANPTSPVQFGSWGEGSHVIEAVTLETGGLVVDTKTGGYHQWFKDIPGSYHDGYNEFRDIAGTTHGSAIVDYVAAFSDVAQYDALSPSKPSDTLTVPSIGNGDDRLIELEIRYGGATL